MQYEPGKKSMMRISRGKEECQHYKVVGSVEFHKSSLFERNERPAHLFVSIGEDAGEEVKFFW